jgi:glycosyltransferase involved in cell wall biosynthesis
MNRIALIAIGRNEGERLKRCLHSLHNAAETIIYVDSGSTDGSREFATKMGAHLVDLDTSSGFTMARARNAGLEKVRTLSSPVNFIHFIDGDCELAEHWIETAMKTLSSRPDIAVVCGRRRERHPEHSLYNRLCDIEWNTPIGETDACGGDALMRRNVLEEVGGFNDALIAGEEPELCSRIRKAGWKVLRLPDNMTWHDANILHFGQWWKRYVRGGYGACDVSRRMRASGAEDLFGGQVQSAALWTMGTILMLLFSAGTSAFLHNPRIFALTMLGLSVLWIGQGIRIGISQRQRAGGLGLGIAYGLSLLFAKWPQSVGLFKYHADLRDGRGAKLIEYKQ